MSISLKSLRSELKKLKEEWKNNEYMIVSYTITGNDTSGYAHISGRDPNNLSLCGDYEDIFFELVSEIAQKYEVKFRDERTYRHSSDIILSW